ncbi:hypothetical protein HY992_00075 [Candidatus Micrarchaeota archaeon]|nr:hypothetical protein [Candidatus Micrarchaeota archaeon]
MDKPTALLGALFALLGAINLFATGGACPYCYAELAGGTAIAGYGLVRKTGECKLQQKKKRAPNKKTSNIQNSKQKNNTTAKTTKEKK